jgi:YcaO-like protein with predicted kinase domain
MPGTNDPGRKTFFRGTHRLVAPGETLETVLPLVRGMGITRIANITGLDRIGIPVATACRPNSRGLAVSQGKGLDLATAKASALMESVESYHAERIELPLRLASYTDLGRTHRLADVAKLALTVGSAFHTDRPVLWVEGYDLLQRDAAGVPYEVVETNYTFPLAAGAGCFQATTNGLASGNHLFEAISHGLCEVIERDALAIWNRRSDEFRSTRRIDLATVDDESAVEVLTRLEHASVVVAAWDMTTDVGVPCVLATIIDRPNQGLRPLYPANGSGCHPDRYVALLRALLEAIQSRLTFIVGSRDDNFRDDYDRLLDPRTTLAVLATVQAPPVIGFGRLPHVRHETFLDDVRHEVCRLETAGINQAIVVNLTKPEWRIPVVRVVVPGLEGVSTQPDYVPGERARAVPTAALS